jgi:GNAT superfamily N-acetyltransferase
VPAPDESLAWLGADAGRPSVVAEIWGTVDLERALAELRAGAAVGTPDPDAVAIPDPGAIGTPDPGAVDVADAIEDPLLGARVVVLPAAGDGRRIAIAEPSTEGRLAAALARHGEGRLGSYLAPPAGLEAVRARAAAAMVALSRPASGPFGRSMLVLGGPVGGPSLILVERAGGTIAAMTDRPAIALRAAAPADAERIAALFTDEGYPAGPSDIVERLARYDSEHSRVIVAENGGEILGFIAVHALPRFEHSDRILRIMALVVDAGERGRGIGRLLMEEAERHAREIDAAFAEVTAGRHRPDALRLYEELGYDGTVAAYLRKRL